jgi:hypothetical protein
VHLVGLVIRNKSIYVALQNLSSCDTDTDSVIMSLHFSPSSAGLKKMGPTRHNVSNTHGFCGCEDLSRNTGVFSLDQILQFSLLSI